MIYITLLIPVILVLILAGIIRAFSPGKLKPFTNPEGIPLEGSLSEKIFLTIGGVRQGMIIQSRDTAKPVLLYLHGGMPEYFLSKKYPTGLEDLFTVVWWEQRGSGISYNFGLKDTVTVEKLTDDALEITDYLRRRFRKDKIYLMGHSGGTFIGVLTAARAPERYHAYRLG
jgi:pimeloyl-ACP methyl ester carboxylesterase